MRSIPSQSFGLAIVWLLSTMSWAAEPTSTPDHTGRRTAPRNVAIFVFQGMELLDFAGPAEVFQAAGPKFNVYTVAESMEPVVSQKFVKIVPQYSIQKCPKPDLLIMPGGDTSAPLGSPAVIAWVKQVSGEAEVTMSVCTGAFVLAKAGLLDGQPATTNWSQLGRLGKAAPDIQVRSKVRFVDSGKIVTTAGVSAGIDGALHIVDRLLGHTAAAFTARGMEYKWDGAPEPSELLRK
jgi:transcriptional regulator GlxA family with amidase domain